MTVELTPEIEAALRRESTRSGEAPAAIVMRVIESYVRSAEETALRVSRRATAAETMMQFEERLQKVKASLRAVREGVDGSFGPPAGMRYRDWIHEDHTY